MELVKFEGRDYRVDRDELVVKVRHRRVTATTRRRAVGDVWITVRGPKRQRVLESVGISEFGAGPRPRVTVAPHRR